MLQGNTPAIPRLGIPALTLNDGPQGFRGDAGTSTCWPSGLTMAATWNPNTMGAWGTAMGEEFVAKGRAHRLGYAWDIPMFSRDFWRPRLLLDTHCFESVYMLLLIVFALACWRCAERYDCLSRLRFTLVVPQARTCSLARRCVLRVCQSMVATLSI